MKFINGIILTITMLVSCFIWPILICIALLGFFVSAFHLILLILHWIFPKFKLTYFIKSVGSDNQKAKIIIKWIYILSPVTLILIITFSFLNSWYQVVGYYDYYMLFLASLFICIELSIILMVRNWDILKLKGIYPLLLTLILFGLNITYDRILGDAWGMNRLIIDRRLQYNLPQYTELIKNEIPSPPVDMTEIQVSKDFPAMRVFVSVTPSDILMVRFTTGGWGWGGGTHHWGYIYIANDNIANFKSWKLRKIQTNWYWYWD